MMPLGATVKAASPGNMLASGWTKNTFKAGDQISVSFVPAKGDRTFGICPCFPTDAFQGTAGVPWAEAAEWS